MTQKTTLSNGTETKVVESYCSCKDDCLRHSRAVLALVKQGWSIVDNATYSDD